MANNDHWIEKATANSHGQFAAKAKADKMSTKAYASKVESGKVKAGPVTRKQAALASTLMGLHKKG
jgi:hypothetical protein